jgi:hypothetical protein
MIGLLTKPALALPCDYHRRIGVEPPIWGAIFRIAVTTMQKLATSGRDQNEEFDREKASIYAAQSVMGVTG